MFWVFNKQKIYSYLVAASTVAILLVGSIFLTGNKMDAFQTSSSLGKLVPIYNVETNKQRISLTINCAWSQHQMG